MTKCAIINCKNESKVVNRGNRNVSFHVFPKDPDIKEKWIEATGAKDWFPTKHSAICSIHFNEDDYVLTKKYRRLSRTAFPKNHILKITSVGEDKDQQWNENVSYEDISNEAMLFDTQGRAELSAINVEQESKITSNTELSLETPRERRLRIRLRQALNTIRQQRLKIKRIREQNRSKIKKILVLEATIERLKNNSVIKEKMSLK